jgi:hypothetical protein
MKTADLMTLASSVKARLVHSTQFMTNG